MTADDAGRMVRVAVCYDGYWYRNASRFFAIERGFGISMAGLHDVIRWYAAEIYQCPVRQVAVTHAHYVAGRGGPLPWLDQELADRAITRHDLPVTAKGEVGADVEFALTCYQIASETSLDMIALITGDGDFAPLAARLAGRGLRVLVPTADFTYLAPGTGTPVTVATSGWLTRAATDTPALTQLLDAANDAGYPADLARPRTTVRPDSISTDRQDRQGSARRGGVVSHWTQDQEYGFINCHDGMTWFASIQETPAGMPLPPGTVVTFTGYPTVPLGKSYPRARAIRLEPTALSQPPGAITESHSQPVADSRPGQEP